MKARQVLGENDVLTLEAGEAITAFRLVDTAGKHTVKKEAVGVALFDTDLGSIISVGAAPIEVVEAGGTCTAGGGLSSDANGCVVNYASSGIIIGYAIDTASSGYIRVLLTHGCKAA
jgi:hypothetical protein